MEKTAVVVLAVAVAVAMFAAAPIMATNLITNGDFELGTSSGWDTWFWGGAGAIVPLDGLVGWEPGDGSYSAAVSMGYAFSQRFATEVGHTYRVSMIYQRTLSVPVYVRTATPGDAWTDGVVLLDSGVLPDSGAAAHTSPYLGSYTGDFTATSSLSKIVIANETFWATFDNVTIEEVVASPVISPEGGRHTASMPVTITCSTAGAVIHYTTDGSTPTTASPVYASPFSFTDGMTVKAIAVKSGALSSDIVTVSYVISDELIVNGDFELGNTSGWDTWLYGGDAGMFVVSYSGGWTPGDGNYSMAVSLNSALSQRFNTQAGHTYRVSLIYQRTLSVPVYVRTATTGDIWTDGAVLLNSGVLPDSGAPAHTSPYLGSYTGEFTATSSLSKIVIANEAYYASFDNVSVTSVVASPVISPAGGQYIILAPVTITCATEGAVIHYTTDDTDPTAASPVYTGPITVTDGTTVKAIAVKSGLGDSIVVTETYRIPSARPKTISYSDSITINGDLSDWSSSDFVPLDTVYYEVDPVEVPISILSASYAAKWGDNGDKVYVAVKVQDPTPFLVDAPTAWNGQDSAEFYIHAPVGGVVNYNSGQEAAQHFSIGIQGSNHNNSWGFIGEAMSLGIPAEAGLTRAVNVVGQWLQYEVAMTPYQYFGVFTSQPNVPFQLRAGDLLGVDVAVNDKLDYYDYAGMLTENGLAPKFDDYNAIALHLLVKNATIVEAKNAEDGDGVTVFGVVTAAFADYFYVETPDRVAGIRVYQPGHGVSENQAVSVSGVVSTLPDTGERYIHAVTVANGGSTTPIAPIGASNRGITGPGLATTGLLVRAWGKVTDLGSGLYQLDDGSGTDLKIKVLSGTFDITKTVSVTGVASLYKYPSTSVVTDMIIVKDAATDIKAY